MKGKQKAITKKLGHRIEQDFAHNAKHAFLTIAAISKAVKWSFQVKNCIFFPLFFPNRLNFTIQKWGLRRSKLHRHVSMMLKTKVVLLILFYIGEKK